MKSFRATLYEGHSDCAVIVPFDPSGIWDATPRRIGYRKHVGYAVRGKVNDHPFEGWIWHYFHEWRLVIPEVTLAKARVGPGDPVQVKVAPHPQPETVEPYSPGPKRK